MQSGYVDALVQHPSCISHYGNIIILLSMGMEHRMQAAQGVCVCVFVLHLYYVPFDVTLQINCIPKSVSTTTNVLVQTTLNGSSVAKRM